MQALKKELQLLVPSMKVFLVSELMQRLMICLTAFLPS